MAAAASPDDGESTVPVDATEQAPGIHLIGQCIDLGMSCLVVGEAGTGKTSLVRALFNTKRFATEPVMWTAMTGLAAIHLHPVLGQTFHSAFGIRNGRETVEEWIAALEGDNSRAAEVRGSTVCVVDEVSMMDAVLFDKLDRVLRAIRRNPSSPFGGMSVMFIGDFHQLPPIAAGRVPCSCSIVPFFLFFFREIRRPSSHVRIRAQAEDKGHLFLHRQYSLSLCRFAWSSKKRGGSGATPSTPRCARTFAREQTCRLRWLSSTGAASCCVILGFFLLFFRGRQGQIWHLHALSACGFTWVSLRGPV